MGDKYEPKKLIGENVIMMNGLKNHMRKKTNQMMKKNKNQIMKKKRNQMKKKNLLI